MIDVWVAVLFGIASFFAGVGLYRSQLTRSFEQTRKFRELNDESLETIGAYKKTNEALIVANKSLLNELDRSRADFRRLDQSLAVDTKR